MKVYFVDRRKHTFQPFQLLVGEICVGQQGSFNEGNMLEI